VLDSSEPTIFIAHAFHLTHQPSDLGIYVLSYLLPRSSLLAVNSAKLGIQVLGHFISDSPPAG